MSFCSLKYEIVWLTDGKRGRRNTQASSHTSAPWSTLYKCFTAVPLQHQGESFMLRKPSVSFLLPFDSFLQSRRPIIFLNVILTVQSLLRHAADAFKKNGLQHVQQLNRPPYLAQCNTKKLQKYSCDHRARWRCYGNIWHRWKCCVSFNVLVHEWRSTESSARKTQPWHSEPTLFLRLFCHLHLSTCSVFLPSWSDVVNWFTSWRHQPVTCFL